MTPYFAKVTGARRSVPRELPPAEVSVPRLSSNPPPVKKTHLLEHPLAQHALAILRNKDTPPHLFRLVSNQLLMLLMLEAARHVPVRRLSVQTAAGAHEGHALSKPIVVLTVARHGLGLAHNVADLFPDLLVGVISMDRGPDGKSVEPRLHIANAPALGDACVILFDPVVASGGSAHAALNLVRRSGATELSLISLLVSLPGLSRLQSSFPDLQVWTAAIDTELDAKRGPLPGLGNFAERLYG